MKKVFALLSLVVLTAVTSFASVTFDPATGKGFVGKGDVQSVLGLNNAQVQVLPLTFTYESEQTYEVTVEWDNEVGKNKVIEHKTITVRKTVEVTGEISYTARKQNQISGFFLTGYSGTVSESGNVPVVGAPFNSGNDGKVITAVNLVSSSNGGLKVNGVSLY